MVLEKGDNRNDAVYYGYLCLMRPPMPGAVPIDGLIQCDDKEGRSMESGHHYWGRVVYSRKLTEGEIRHFDLEPTALAALD